MKLTKFFKEEIRALFKILRIAFSKNKESRKFVWQMFKYQRQALKKRKKFEKKDLHIPPMLLISVTEKCNLKCKGCYAKSIEEMTSHDKEELNLDEYKKIFDEALTLGISIITLVGGEPLLRKSLIELAATYQKIIFSIYTNGLLLGKDYKELILKNRNLIPFFSLEGYQGETDDRRGNGVYDLVIEKMRWMKEKHLLFGVSITITPQNLTSVTSYDFVKMLEDFGCVYISYVEFEAMDEESKALALTKEKRQEHLENYQRVTKEFKKIFFTSYPDFEYRSGGCLGAGRGFFHINAYGDAEPCNFVPISDMNLKEKKIVEVLKSPLFKDLIEKGLLDHTHDGQCALMSHKDKWENQIKK